MSRNYRFDESKIDKDFQAVKMTVTKGQLAYEREHLLKKLAVRDKERFTLLRKLKIIEPFPIFELTDGKIADWEIRNEPPEKSR